MTQTIADSIEKMTKKEDSAPETYLIIAKTRLHLHD